MRARRYTANCCVGEIGGSVSFKVYFDFTCPYSYDLRKWLDHADLGYDIHWRGFLQAQSHDRRPNYRLFDHSEEHPPGLAALCAYHALRSSGDPHTDGFHRAVLESKHERGVDIDDVDELCKIAADLGIDSALVGDAAGDQKVIQNVAAEHEDAVMAYAMTDTPTIVSPDHESLYVRLGAPPENEATARRVVKTIVDIALTEPAIRELRRT
ncbi:MAG: hypothetical protein DYH08_11205 [Actinobacteria bacterium ATB1]|nr:hypothetical protein [Actinobacteria bacterium ATB1]